VAHGQTTSSEIKEEFLKTILNPKESYSITEPQKEQTAQRFV
jgi:hypothetical protein